MALELYAPILSKSVSTGAGGVPVAVLVTGKVTGSGLDLDDQIVDAEWAAKALQEWYHRAGNIREMHQNNAVGKAVDLQRSDDGDGFDITARITEPGAVQKVVDGVLQGFSIGIKRRASDPPIVVRDNVAKGGRIQAGLITEISLVDAPAYPAAKISNIESLWKMAGSDGDELVEDDAPADTDLTKAADDDATRKSPPKGYPQDKADYADPSRFGFPIDTPARVRSAMAYYNAGKGKGEQGRSGSDWEAIGKKIASAANEHFGPGHSLKGDQIVHEDDTTKKSLTETLAGVIPVLTDGDGVPVPGNVRWLKAADGTDTAVAADLSYDPFPTEDRNGFGTPPDPTGDASFADTSQALTSENAKAAAPNGQSVVPGPNDAAHHQPVAHPETPSVPSANTSVDANTLAPTAGGFGHQSPSDLAKALQANLDALNATGTPDITKNGVARALGPTAMSLLYQMLSNEVGEDGGTGSCACDIASIACAYDKLYCFICSELDEEGDTPDSLPGMAMAKDASAALFDLARRLDPALATAGVEKSAPDADLEASDVVKSLRADVERLSNENTDLQKSLNATPAPGGPVKTFVAPGEADAPEVSAKRVDEALARFANEHDPRAKLAAWNTYWTLTHPN